MTSAADAHLPVGKMLGENGGEKRVVGRADPDRHRRAQARAEVGQRRPPRSRRQLRSQQQAAAAFAAGVDQVQQGRLRSAVGVVDRDPQPGSVEKAGDLALFQEVCREPGPPLPARTTSRRDGFSPNALWARAPPMRRDGQSGQRSIQARAAALLPETMKSARPSRAPREKSKTSWVISRARAGAAVPSAATRRAGSGGSGRGRSGPRRR